MDHINKFDILKYPDWITVWIVNITSQVIWTLLYVVQDKFLLPEDTNTIQTQCVVSKSENSVDTIEPINESNVIIYLILYYIV